MKNENQKNAEQIVSENSGKTPPKKEKSSFEFKDLIKNEKLRSLMVVGFYLILFAAIFIAAAVDKGEENGFLADEEAAEQKEDIEEAIDVEEQIEEGITTPEYNYFSNHDFDYKIKYNINNLETNEFNGTKTENIYSVIIDEELLFTIDELTDTKNIKEMLSISELTTRTLISEKRFSEEYLVSNINAITYLPSLVEKIGEESLKITIYGTGAYISEIEFDLKEAIEESYVITVNFLPIIE